MSDSLFLFQIFSPEFRAQTHRHIYPFLKSMRHVTRQYTNTTTTSSSGQLKCDGTRAENRFRLSAKRLNPFKSAGASAQSITGSRGVRISGSNGGYTMFRGSVKGSGYPLHSPVSPSLHLPYVTEFHHISTGVYINFDVGESGVWGRRRRRRTGDLTSGDLLNLFYI